MSKNKTYSEKLRDPRWQKKRLEILERDNFTCQNCFSQQKELHVHHLFYKRKKEPWEIDNEFLSCLCSDCHLLRQEAEDSIKIRMASLHQEELRILDFIMDVRDVLPNIVVQLEEIVSCIHHCSISYHLNTKIFKDWVKPIEDAEDE